MTQGCKPSGAGGYQSNLINIRAAFGVYGNGVIDVIQNKWIHGKDKAWFPIRDTKVIPQGNISIDLGSYDFNKVY
jgi:hypothetical protein